MVGVGCAGPRWPATVHAAGDPAFLAEQRDIDTIDILPVDLQVWTRPDHPRGARALADALAPLVDGVVAAHLAEHGYRVTAQVGWDGRFVAPDGLMRRAMSAAEVARTAYSLSSYGPAETRLGGASAAARPGGASAETRPGGAPATARAGAGDTRLLVPYLPVRLGRVTRSDATLYIGGWAYAGKDGPSTAAKVVEVVLVVAVVAVVVAAVIAGARDGGGGAVAGVARGAGRVAGATAHAVGYGPHGGRSAMLLDLTLIDNHTGLVLWHARQRFPARPDRPHDVERAVVALLAALPPAR